jgi:hypothetical protein
MEKIIQQHLDLFNEQFAPLNMGYPPAAQNHNNAMSFLEQALQSTWNAAVKDTVERTKLPDKVINPLFPDICIGYKSAVTDQNELINKLI